MANQTDNVLLDDDTTGLPRTIDVGVDDLVLSTDLTLQAGGILTADNIKRGTADPNVALVAGNEGDVYERTLAGTGQLWVNTDGTNTGWKRTVLDTDGVLTWAEVLVNGNVSGGTDPQISTGDSLIGENNGAGNGGDLPITAGSSTGGGGDGGDVILTPGSGNGAGVAGIVQVNGVKHYPVGTTNPANPAPADGDRYYNSALGMEMRYDAPRAKWLSVETATLLFGRNGDVGAVGTYLRAMDGMVTSATRGYDALYNGTVVGWTIRRSTSSTATYAVTASGVNITSLSFGAGVQGVRDTAANANFVQGAVLAVRLTADGVPPESNVQITVRIKWRV